MCMPITKNKEFLKDFEDGVYIIQNGRVTKLDPKPFGHDTLCWKNGEVLDVERSERIRVKS